ncbi:hypothetical protein [Streptomyces sp. NPDC001020]
MCLAALRQALKDLNPTFLKWDNDAFNMTVRELEPISPDVYAGQRFAVWWQELFREDYRTFATSAHTWRGGTTVRPYPGGGTGTGGTGGFNGGFGGGFWHRAPWARQ